MRLTLPPLTVRLVRRTMNDYVCPACDRGIPKRSVAIFTRLVYTNPLFYDGARWWEHLACFELRDREEKNHGS